MDIKTDVLVIGGGGAGAMAAVKARAHGARVVVANKGPYPSGNTSLAKGGFAAALGDSDQRDNPQVHFEDLMKAGMINNAKVVKAWTDEIVELTRELDRWGVAFLKTGDKFFQDIGAGYTYPRIVRHNAMGIALTKICKDKGEDLGVEVLEHVIIGGFLTTEQQVIGAWGLAYKTGEFVVIQAKAIILATGGMGNILPVSDSVRGITGEGYMLAFRAGAELVDMEMADYQMTPCYPEQMKGHGANAGLFLESNKARLYNGLGERFVKKYFPDTGERGRNRAVIARCVAQEMSEGRVGKHGGIFLDASDMTPELLERPHFKKVVVAFQNAGVDIKYQPMELVLALHTGLGGAKIDETCATNLMGLFACGEVAGGVHGAARMGAAALSSMLATGSIAGRNAAHYSNSMTDQISLDDHQISEAKRKLDKWGTRKEGIEPQDLKKKIHRVTGKYLTMVRDGEGLTTALEELNRLERDMLPQLSAGQPDESKLGERLRDAIEVDGQLELAQVVATAALCRQESRGGHYRKDYPEKDDDNWLKNIVLKRENGNISHRTMPTI